ncbi:MAG: DUF4359 domain-containing protein [Cyanobacteria bacterium]|nr:DUF4359 domain-containing protein [Cyanobacteriota bacterium]MEB3268616.1 DUF4359 domain-containing protein [Leptolyngbya sp.]
MKPRTLVGFLLAGAGIGALVATNPGPDAYQRYALEQATLYFNESVCNDLPAGVADLLQGRCAEIVAMGQPQLQTLIRDRTERLNLGVCSIYRTTLGLPEGIPGLESIPTYEVKTLGIAGYFLPINAGQQP